jgi:hypothetical protein
MGCHGGSPQPDAHPGFRARGFYCDTRIAGAAAVDHFIPWSRHPDNGIENLVVADRRCNSFKRDFVPATELLERWRAERFGPSGGDLPALAEIASQLGWEHHPERTFAAAGAIFLCLPPDAKLWHREKSFVAPKSEILAAVFGPL